MGSRKFYLVIYCALAVIALSLYSAMMVMPASGYDFHIFYAAAAALQHGGNPYSIHDVFAQEQHLYPMLLKNHWQRQWIQRNPFVQGPLLLIALLPAIQWSPNAVYPVWFGLLMLMAAASLVVLSRLWPLQHPLRWSFFLLLSPVAFIGPFLGQVDALLLLAFVMSLWCLKRDQFLLAGLVITIGLIKPQIMIGPILILAGIAWRRHKLRPYLCGSAAGIVGLAGITAMIGTPALLTAWLTAIFRFTGGSVYVQDDISSLTSLYLRWMPHRWDAVVSIGLAAAWCAACIWAWRRIRSTVDEQWWLNAALVGWLLATPYAHPHDDILLLPPMWYVFGHLTTGRLVRVALTGLFLAWWSLPMAYVLWGSRVEILALRGLGVVPVLLLALVIGLHRRPVLSVGYPSPLPASQTVGRQA